MFYIGGRGFVYIIYKSSAAYVEHDFARPMLASYYSYNYYNTSEMQSIIIILLCQIIEPVMFARCAFIIFALRNIALGGTRINISARRTA